MNYIDEYKRIYEGENFIRDGKKVTLHDYHAFDGGGARVLFDKVLSEIETRESVTILDYGAGEGLQWHEQVLLKRTASLPNLIGKKLRGFYRYDPAYKIYDKRPAGKYDIIICADVLEHVPDEELENFFKDINSFLEPSGVIFYSISTQLSRNVFDTGINMHVNIKSPNQWFSILKQYARNKFCVVFNGKHNY